ncbi:TonB-dependent receptor [Roseateles sp. BYS180W]|uniref:TonB-dependent receptor n=1 Tax=Roseateles rivi TaxID=3299028 RepID=A0ABW7FT27_9BURK
MTQKQCWTWTPVAWALWALAQSAVAQTSPGATPVVGQRLERVEVTGTAIKRLADESALPVQVLSREDIAKAGATTAADIVALLSAGAKGLNDGASIANGGARDQMGLNAANLRGLGSSSTLVLLNGRRLANFAAPGDEAAVDLNNIPAAAVQRVEVLLDGASALYGSDAIGGVINFITRQDYQGLELDAYAYRTQEGGAGRRTLSLAGGAGDLGRDRFNLFGVLDLQQNDALSTAQRRFISDLRIPERLPHLLSSATFPGNIRLTRDQRDYLQAQGFAVTGQTIAGRTINLAAPQCQAPHSLYLPDGIGGVDACTYDYMRDVELYPESRKYSGLLRAVAQLTPEHQLFAEFSHAQARTAYVSTSNRVDADVPIALIPRLAATGLDQGDPEATVVVRTRLLEAGRRHSELSSSGQRLVLGARGSFAGWDYDSAINHSRNRVDERDGAGYLLYDQVMAGFLNGTLNPFGPNSDAGRALLAQAQVNNNVRQARGTLSSVDAKFSRALTQLAGGDLMLALGAELRRESTRSWASDLLLSDNILGDSTPGDAQTTQYSRRAWALWSELSAPLTRELELGLALRHDRYQDVGSSSTPKLSLRWQPSRALLLRGAVGTGFRAPTVNDLHRPVRVSTTATLADPVYCAENDNDLGVCADNWETRTYANPKLKPERSVQGSLGLVFEAGRHFSGSLDYWAITKRDLISTLGDDVILANLAKYEPLVHRYSENEGLAGCDYDATDNSICFIELRKENRGRHKASGLDLALQLRELSTGAGQFGLSLQSTYMLRSERQTGNGDPYISNLGRFVTDGAVQRWRHRLSLDWHWQQWSAALSNQYISGYEDQNNAIDTNSGSVVARNRVRAYSLWDLSAAVALSPALTLRAGVKNLANTAPPFSNQAYHFISGYNPADSDPRGRAFTLNLQYRVK